MPADELRVVRRDLRSESGDRAFVDPLVRRHLELHQEWLDERLAAQKRLVVAIGLILTDPRDRDDGCDGARSGELAVAG